MAEKTILNTPSEPGCEIYFWLLEESPSELEEVFLKELADGERPTLPKLPKRRMEVMAEHILVRRHSGAKLSHYPDGAPRLVGSEKHISISHCKGLVCMVLADWNIGIDVEDWSQRAWEIRERFLNKEEQQFSLLPEREKTTLLLWCAKEAAFKLFREKETSVTQIQLSSPETDSQSEAIAILSAKSVKGKTAKIHLYADKNFAIALSQ